MRSGCPAPRGSAWPWVQMERASPASMPPKPRKSPTRRPMPFPISNSRLSRRPGRAARAPASSACHRLSDRRHAGRKTVESPTRKATSRALCASGQPQRHGPPIDRPRGVRPVRADRGRRAPSHDRPAAGRLRACAREARAGPEAGRSQAHRRLKLGLPRSSSPAPARSARSRWSRATPTPATCRPRRTCPGSSTSCVAAATRSDATPTPSRRRRHSASMSARTAPRRARSSTSCAGCKASASSRSSAGWSTWTPSRRWRSWAAT